MPICFTLCLPASRNFCTAASSEVSRSIHSYLVSFPQWAASFWEVIQRILSKCRTARILTNKFDFSFRSMSSSASEPTEQVAVLRYFAGTRFCWLYIGAHHSTHCGHEFHWLGQEATRFQQHVCLAHSALIIRKVLSRITKNVCCCFIFALFTSFWSSDRNIQPYLRNPCSPIIEQQRPSATIGIQYAHRIE